MSAKRSTLRHRSKEGTRSGGGQLENHRLDASFRFYQLDASFSSSYIKPVDFIELHQVCEK